MSPAAADLDPVLHAAAIAGRAIRFFRAPCDALPWVCHGDLCALAGLPLADQDHLIEHVRPTTEHEMGLIKVPEGDEVAISHLLAVGLLGHLLGEGLIEAAVTRDYTAAAEAALAAIHGGTAPPALVENIRAASLAMYDFDGRPS